MVFVRKPWYVFIESDMTAAVGKRCDLTNLVPVKEIPLAGGRAKEA
jgi:hypothetical protein